MTYKLPKGASGDAVLAGVEYLNNAGEAGREELHISCCEGSGLSRTMSEWLVSESSAQNCPVGKVWEKYPKKWPDGRRVAYRLTDLGRTFLGQYDPPGRRLKERTERVKKLGASVGDLVRVKTGVSCYTFDLSENSYGTASRQFIEYKAEDPRMGVLIGWSRYYPFEDQTIFGPYVDGDETSLEQWSGNEEPIAVILMPVSGRILARMPSISLAKSGGKR